MAAAKAYRNALLAMSSATAAFATAMEACSRLAYFLVICLTENSMEGKRLPYVIGLRAAGRPTRPWQVQQVFSISSPIMNSSWRILCTANLRYLYFMLWTITK